MGRVLQKKKNRSSIPKVKPKRKSKKKLLANPIIAANWDQKQTLTQNYRRLGLTAKLNNISGGAEKFASSVAKPSPRDHLTIASTSSTVLERGLARIERDPVTGAILRVIEDLGIKAKRANPLHDPLNDLDEDEMEVDVGTEDGQMGGFNTGGNGEARGGTAGIASATSTVMKELEECAARGEKKAARKFSTREREWMRTLVDKHGEDYRAMSRDMKLNVMQQSEGDIKRRVRRWREAHVTEPVR